MKFLKSLILVVSISILTGCASTYKIITPNSLDYISKNVNKEVLLEYKYELLSKKYKKKEESKGVRLVAVKITNNSNKDLVFGKDVKLIYDDGSAPYIMEIETIFSTLKQSPSSYLWYLLLTPLKLTQIEYETDIGRTVNDTPIGFALGPVAALANMTIASSANNKFKTNLLAYNINGNTIKSGETMYGLIGIRSDDYNSIKVKVE